MVVNCEKFSKCEIIDDSYYKYINDYKTLDNKNLDLELCPTTGFLVYHKV